MQTTKKISLILGVLVMSFAVVYLAAATWHDAPDTPPGCPPGYPGCDPPVHVGTADQIKRGPLGVEGVLHAHSDLRVSGNLIAPDNTRDDCAWTSWTCDAAQTCPSPKFVAGVERGTTLSLCGSGVTRWYQMKLYCCNL